MIKVNAPPRTPPTCLIKGVLLLTAVKKHSLPSAKNMSWLEASIYWRPPLKASCFGLAEQEKLRNVTHTRFLEFCSCFLWRFVDIVSIWKHPRSFDSGCVMPFSVCLFFWWHARYASLLKVEKEGMNEFLEKKSISWFCKVLNESSNHLNSSNCHFLKDEQQQKNEGSFQHKTFSISPFKNGLL